MLVLSAAVAVATSSSGADAPLKSTADAAGVPRDAPSELKRLIGEYRSAEAQLTIYEVGGQLFANGFGLQHAPLRRLSATRFSAEDKQPQTRLEFESDRDRQ